MSAATLKLDGQGELERRGEIATEEGRSGRIEDCCWGGGAAGGEVWLRETGPMKRGCAVDGERAEELERAEQSGEEGEAEPCTEKALAVNAFNSEKSRAFQHRTMGGVPLGG